MGQAIPHAGRATAPEFDLKLYILFKIVRPYCKLDRDKAGASGPRGACARDFVNFRKKFHASRALGAAARV
jgi:hypothetical protein